MGGTLLPIPHLSSRCCAEEGTLTTLRQLLSDMHDKSVTGDSRVTRPECAEVAPGLVETFPHRDVCILEQRHIS
jgi:hypothetical protein